MAARGTTANWVDFLGRVEGWIGPSTERVYALMEGRCSARWPSRTGGSTPGPRSSRSSSALPSTGTSRSTRSFGAAAGASRRGGGWTLAAPFSLCDCPRTSDQFSVACNAAAVSRADFENLACWHGVRTEKRRFSTALIHYGEICCTCVPGNLPRLRGRTGDGPPLPAIVVGCSATDPTDQQW